MSSHMWGYGYDLPWMLLGWLWMALVWLIPLALLLALAKYLFSRPKDAPQPPGPREKSPVDLLKEAYARGEVGREDYLQKLEDLKRD